MEIAKTKQARRRANTWNAGALIAYRSIASNGPSRTSRGGSSRGFEALNKVDKPGTVSRVALSRHVPQYCGENLRSFRT